MNARLSVAPGELDGELILAIARHAIAERFGAAALEVPEHPWLQQRAATFVTLHIHAPGEPPRLQGCIGSVEAHRPLIEDLRHNAVMAAFHDPRFRPLRSDQLARTHVSVSVLGPHRALEFRDQADARAKLRPGVDGLILSYDDPRTGRHRGLFLPQVWATLAEPAEFLDQLKRKAGLPLSFWSDQVRLDRFEVVHFSEPPPR